MAKRPKLDVLAFIMGVDTPTDEVELCIDLKKRELIESLMSELASLVNAEQTLGEDSRIEEIQNELRELQEDESAWAKFAVRAPSNETRVKWMAVASGEAEDRGQNMVDAQTVVLAECIKEINGTEVELSHEEAHLILSRWPDSMAVELINKINELSGSVDSVPFSQRLAAALKTQ